ncbi:putative ubiquitin-conjugating enzyme E2, ubiquitin-conjugating enzyme/RWD [Helianthus annuus]|nr:putative ubiquitin-conjugating enzyme E2, ubiquitin-conjugating enzyme/RWD [Helianthus annuus]
MDEDGDDVVILEGKEIAVDPGHSPKGFNPGSNNFFDIDDYVFDDEYGTDLVPTRKNNPAIPYVTSNAQLEASVSHPNRIDPMPTSTMFSSSKKSSVDGEVKNKYESFNKFDTVVDHSDHHYAGQSSAMTQASFHPKIGLKRYKKSGRFLRKTCLGTPYHDGLFLFDVCFPSDYPNSPPLVYYHSGGLHVNPNLYDSGKVCLSLLNTWHGAKKEMWNPRKSTMLQVLVSIQGLILNMKPL